MTGDREGELFQALIVQLTQAGWAALGKLPNPLTGEIERSLETARLTIDTLAAIETRTRGNLADAERKLLERSLRELRLNYLDEAKKGEAGGEAGRADEAAAPDEAAGSQDEGTTAGGG